MNLKDYVDGLNKLLKSNPELAEAKVISSADDEGNSYNFVNYKHSVYYVEKNWSHYIEYVIAEDELEDVSDYEKVVLIN